MSNNETRIMRPAERAFLVGTELRGDRAWMSAEDSLDELARLADTAGLEVIGRATQRLDHPNANTFIGPGKAEEVKNLAGELGASVVLFDETLSPRHQRELESIFGDDLRLLDRTALILDIFAQHAQTREGKLQVELAQLQYRLPRLTRMWTHLARQAGTGGGSVGLRGPGETQLEIDRRLIGQRISTLKEQLEEVKAHRRRHRHRRQQTELLTVAIVGYTNAGKSTLLNRLAGSDVLEADMLFATLDPTTRRVSMPGGREVLVTDTVGFIQKLPTEIVAAFRATLEEIQDADILLHVIDASHPQAHAQYEAVRDTLAELEIEHLPTVIALNKIDLMPPDTPLHEQIDVPLSAVPISAATGEGIELLKTAIEAATEFYMRSIHVRLPFQRGDLYALFHERGQITEESTGQDGIELVGRVPQGLLPFFEPYRL